MTAQAPRERRDGLVSHTEVVTALSSMPLRQRSNGRERRDHDPPYDRRPGDEELGQGGILQPSGYRGGEPC